MKLVPSSYDSNSLTGYSIFRFMGDSWETQSPVDVRYSPRADAEPIFGVNIRKERTITLGLQMGASTAHTEVDTLNKIFNTKGTAERALVATDSDDSNRQWYLNAIPARIKIQGAAYIADLKAGYGYWRTVGTATDAWAGTASGETHDIAGTAVFGNAHALPVISFMPTAAKGGGNIYRRLVINTNPTDVTLTGGYNIAGTAGWDTATAVSGGKVQADGDDVRVFVDNREQDRWFGTSTHDINQAATFIYTNLTWQPRIELTTLETFGTATVITTLPFARPSGKSATSMWKRLPASGLGLVGSEVFTWTGKDDANFKVTGVTRSALGTSAGTASAGSTFKWMEHLIWVLYGSTTLTAPVVDDTYKPIIDLANINVTRAYTVFTDNAGKRTMSWQGGVNSRSGPDTEVYTGSHTAFASPATEMGMAIRSWLKGNRYQDENADLQWNIYVPEGATAIDATRQTYRNSSAWPKIAALYVSDNGRSWGSPIFNDGTASPGTAGTWGTITSSGVSLGGTKYYIRFQFKGGVGAGTASGGTPYEADWEINSATLYLDTSRQPTISFGSEITDVYDLDATLSVSPSGDSFRITRQIKINQTLVVDCANKLVYLQEDNTRGPLPATPQSQLEWLRLTPGVTNTFTLTETGLTAMTVTTTWQCRSLS